MNLSFNTAHLRRICEERSFASKILGEKLTALLCARLEDISSMDSLTELDMWNFRTLDSKNCSIDLCEAGKWVIIFTHGHAVPPKMNNGSIDWNAVRRIKILRIEKKQ